MNLWRKLFPAAIIPLVGSVSAHANRRSLLVAAQAEALGAQVEAERLALPLEPQRDLEEWRSPYPAGALVVIDEGNGHVTLLASGACVLIRPSGEAARVTVASVDGTLWVGEIKLANGESLTALAAAINDNAALREGLVALAVGKEGGTSLSAQPLTLCAQKTQRFVMLLAEAVAVCATTFESGFWGGVACGLAQQEAWTFYFREVVPTCANIST